MAVSIPTLLIHFPVGQGAKRLIFFTMQAKLFLEKIATCFFYIYFTLLFIHTFVSHFSNVTFFFKAVVFFLYFFVSMTPFAKYELNLIRVLQENPF